MTRVRWVRAFACWFACAALPAQEPPAPPATVRASVDRVSVGVIVTDARGNFLEGLRKDDFRVFDDGVEQPIAEFASVNDPAQVVLLVETGPAVYLLESNHLQAALALLEGLAPGDSVAVAGYTDRALPVLGFTTDKRAAANALDSLRFRTGFADLNLSSALAGVLSSLASLPGKKTIVLLSTGLDTSPPPARDAVLDALRLGDVRVLAVSLSAGLRGAPAKGKRAPSSEKSGDVAAGLAEADARLKALAEITGGRAFFPANGREMSAAFAQIAQLVRHEYSLSFVPPARDAKPHSIEVRLALAAPPHSQAAARLSHRLAYRAPSPP
ncbi:MAG TPA: VWA domain-containing protein [Methylomirabilota bacterium]|nr:VWA domain-containing protein [Methylomirabilota bacterium]